MNNAADSSQTSPSDSGAAGAGRNSSKQQQVITALETEIDQWQARIDAAKLQMHQGAKDAREKLRPHIGRIEQDLGRVKASWAQLEESSENAWNDTHHGLKISLLALRRSFEKAKQNFDNPDDS